MEQMSAYGIKQRKVTKASILFGITKLLISALFIYEGWYIEKYGAIPMLLQALAALIVFFMIACKIYMPQKRKRDTAIVIWWTIFGIVAFIVGLFSSYNYVINDALFTYFAFLLMCFCTGFLTENGNDSWISKTIIITALLCAFCTMFDGFNYKNGGYYGITMSENNNPNTLGMMMAIGVFYLIMPKYKQSVWMWLVRIVLSYVCVHISLNTGSRSSLICMLTVIGLSIYFNVRYYLTGNYLMKILKRLLIIIVCLISIIFVLSYVQSIESGTSGINRLIENFNEASYNSRIRLYSAAWNLFLERPMFGVGYKCFSFFSNFDYFTHSTYMELLSCTGLVGFFLFMIPIFKGLKNAITYRRQDNGRTLTLLLMFVVGGFFGILYYNLIFMMLLYLMILNINFFAMEDTNDKNDCA